MAIPSFAPLIWIANIAIPNGGIPWPAPPWCCHGPRIAWRRARARHGPRAGRGRRSGGPASALMETCEMNELVRASHG